MTMWEPAPESAYHSVEDGGGIKDMVLKLLIRDAWSEDSPAIGVQEACGVCGAGAAKAGVEVGTPP